MVSISRVFGAGMAVALLAGPVLAQDDPPAAETPAVASAVPPSLPTDVAGLGIMTCLAVNQRFSANFRYYQSLGMDAETAYWTSFQGMLHWALGYMSHRNRALAQTGAPVVNLQPEGFDHARQLDFLRDWCVANPTLTFNDAVEALFADLAFARGGR